MSSVSTVFGYAESEEHGSVYFPINAWRGRDGREVEELSSAVGAGDVVEYSAVPQPPVNGCVWRAVRVRPALALAAASRSQETQTAPAAFPVPLLHPASTPRRAHVAVQTALGPETLLLHALRSNDRVRAVLQEAFPNLVSYIQTLPTQL